MEHTILIADDNEQLSSMLKDVLESWGYIVRTATEGYSCLEIARQEPPDLILLDIMLPGMSGYEVCDALKRDTRTRSIAVVMLTALEDLESRIHGYKVGADNFLVKPIKYDEVKAIIRNLLDKKLYQDTLEESGNVAGMLQDFSRMVAVKPAGMDACRMEYCNKLLESLGWDAATGEQARIALMFTSSAELAKQANTSPEQIIGLTDNLRMGYWLKPVLQFLHAPTDTNEELRSVLQNRNCLKAAEMVQVINRYTELLNAKADREGALFTLQKEAVKNRYNQEVLKQLEEILKAEQILERLQTKFQ
ncbi:MAG: response regulator [Acidaminococcaceae bacterium]|nr:response regulator [Acidaminococcaceae bacterium]